MFFDFLKPHRESMSKVDTAWLRMERPTNLMMITGVIIFDEPLEFAKLKETIKSRFLSYERFNQRPVQNNGSAYWERDPNFDLDAHVQRITLPGAADKSELEALASELASTALDQSKPMWQFHLIEKYAGGSALVMRIHHCYADGVALVQVMLSMTDVGKASSAGIEGKRQSKRGKRGPKQGGVGVLERLYAPAKAGVGRAFELGNKALEEGGQLLRDPSRVSNYLCAGTEIAAELAKAVMLPNDTPTRFKGPLSTKKRVAWAEPIPLEEVKALGEALGATVNDVLLSAAAGALRGYLVDQGDCVDGLEIRATVPVNLRPLEHSHELGNQFGLVFLTLPIGIEDPLERLYNIQCNMEALKSSWQAEVTLGLLGAVGLGPSGLQQAALELFSQKASTVFTNVPGPQQPLYIAGAKIGQQMFWVPQSGSIGMGLSILSYNGHVEFGLITDQNLVPEPNNLVDRCPREFEKLLLTTLMGPWGEEASANETNAPSLEAV